MALIAWYKLDGNANDSSGNGYNGTVNGASATSNGKINSAYSFTPATTNNIYTSLPASIIGNGFFSGSVWVKSSGSVTADPRIINTRRSGGSSLWAIRLLSSRTLEAFFWNGTSHIFVSGTTLIENVWYHVAWTYSPGAMKVYLNGILDITVPGIMAAEFYENLTIGNLDYILANAWGGIIDDVRIYNHILSPKEVKELSKANVLHYNFNDFQEPTTNIITNGNFLTGDTTGWSANQNTTLSLFYAGRLTYLRVVSNQNTSTPGVAQTITVEPNTTYAVSLLGFKSSTGTVQMYTSLGSWIGPGFTSYPTKMSATFNSGSNTSIIFYVLFSGVAINDYFQITNVQIEKKSQSTPYVAGSRTGIIKDGSGYENDAALIEAFTPQWKDGQLGDGSYYFNGINQYIGFIGEKLQEKASFSLWFKTSSLTNNTALISQGDSDTTGSPHIRGIRIFNNTVGFWSRDAGGVWQEKVSTITSTTDWYHVVGTQDGVTLRLYVNGVYIDSLTMSSYNTSFGGYYEIGSYTGSDYYYAGYIDDVRFYKTVLSSTDILELYKTRVQVDNSGNTFSNENKELINYLNPNLFSQYCRDTSSPAFQVVDGRNVWVATPSPYHPTAALTGMFKTNTQYEVNITFKHDTYYAPVGYVPGGLVLRYTDGTSLTITTTGGTGEFLNRKEVSAAGKTIACVSVYYYTNYPLYIDINSYMREYTPDSPQINNKGQIVTPKCLSESGIITDLLGWWSLNNTTKDLAGRKTATASNTTIITGLDNSFCYDFNGTTSYVDLNYGLGINPVSKMTITLWVKSDAPTGSRMFLSSGQNPNNNARLYLATYGGYWDMGIYTVGWGTATVSANSNWTFISLVMDGSNAYMYANLQLTKQIAYSSYTLNQNIRLGTHGTDGAYYWDGQIQDVRIYGRALSLAELSVVYNQTGGSNINKVKVEQDTFHIKGKFKETYN